MYAMTSSNPYPVLKTGSGINDGTKRITRETDARELAQQA